MRDPRKYEVWQRSRALVSEIYSLTRAFPVQERRSIGDQIRRAVVSITANLAEGAGRRTDADFARFVDIAKGSANELESLLGLAGDVGLIEPGAARSQLGEIREIRAMCTALAKTLRN